MNVHTLAKIDKAMTEIDMLLWQWQADLDMMVFAGIEFPIITPILSGANPPLDSTLQFAATGLEFPKLEELEVWRIKKTKLDGPLEIDGNSIPVVIYDGSKRQEVGTALAHFEIDEDGNVTQNVSITGRITDPTIENKIGGRSFTGHYSLASYDMEMGENSNYRFSRFTRTYSHPDTFLDMDFPRKLREVPLYLTLSDGTTRQIGLATVNQFGSIQKLDVPYYDGVYQSGYREWYSFVYVGKPEPHVEIMSKPRTPIEMVRDEYDKALRDAVQNAGQNLWPDDEELNNHPFFMTKDQRPDTAPDHAPKEK